MGTFFSVFTGSLHFPATEFEFQIKNKSCSTVIQIYIRLRANDAEI